jgi:phospholipid/cholesterol/gamma-HCH transport system substrate-binding protein
MRRGNDVLVGAVVLVVIAALVGGILWVKESDIGRRQNEIVAHFRDVGNARVGNSVVVRGVVGGRIEGIELASDGWVNVRMKLDPTVRMPIDPVVLLNESSLFGDWQATIVERRALPADEALAREVVDASRERGVLPGASLPGIGKLTAVAGQIAGDVATVARRFGTAFDDSAARDLHASIRNVADLSSTLRAVTEAHASDLDTLSDQLRGAVRMMHRAAGVVEVTARRLDSATTSDQAQQLVQNFSDAAFELRHAATQVRELTTRFQSTQARTETFLATGDSVLSKMNRGQGTLGLLLNDPSLYHRADSLLVELRALSADIRANPKRYLSVRVF